MHAVISGAGVGGLAVARGLAATGWDVTVLERDERPARTGGAVTLFANGFAALRRLGITGTDALGATIRTMDFATATGQRVARVDLDVVRRRTGFGTATVPRRDLLEHLATGLPAGVVRYGCAVSDVSDDGARIVDTDGVEHRPDLLVGADGHRSRVRCATVGPAGARDVGWATWQGLDRVLPQLTDGDHGVCVVGSAGLVGLMPAGDNLLQWWFDVRTPDAADFDDVRRLFGHFPAPVPALLDAVDNGFRFTHRVHDVPERWGRHASTLVGDAAHVFPPSQAQGANQALEDAAVLVEHLAGVDAETISPALRRYEADRAPRVRRMSALAASEVTNRPPSTVMRLAGRMTPPRLAGLAWLANTRRSSSVL